MSQPTAQHRRLAVRRARERAEREARNVSPSNNSPAPRLASGGAPQQPATAAPRQAGAAQGNRMDTLCSAADAVQIQEPAAPAGAPAEIVRPIARRAVPPQPANSSSSSSSSSRPRPPDRKAQADGSARRMGGAPGGVSVVVECEGRRFDVPLPPEFFAPTREAMQGYAAGQELNMERVLDCRIDANNVLHIDGVNPLTADGAPVQSMLEQLQRKIEVLERERDSARSRSAGSAPTGPMGSR